MTWLALRGSSQMAFVAVGALVTGCASSVAPGGHGADASLADHVALDASATDVQPRDVTARPPVNHRTDNSTCLSTVGPGNCRGVALGLSDSCHHDVDCADGGPTARCDQTPAGPADCRCTYDTCTMDDACTMGGPCACHGSPYFFGGNRCVAGNCQVDADCGASGYCSPSRGPSNCALLAGYYCHTAGDTCTDDADCVGGGERSCQFQPSIGAWACAATLFCE